MVDRERIIESAYRDVTDKLFSDLAAAGCIGDSIADRKTFDVNYLAGLGLRHAIEQTVDRVLHASNSKE